jgi:hypothetical protein
MGVTVESATLSSEMYDFITNIFTSPIVLILVGLVLVSITLKKGSLGENEQPQMSILEVILISLFIFLIIVNGLLYFFGIDITTSVSDLFTNKPKIEIDVTNTGIGKEVFHIPGNHYIYPDAKALCKAYGSRLANYDEIEESYKKGGEWCSYGWSEGQMAYFPTQKSTWNQLQGKKGHENDCGRPGINGGYIDNPQIRFGANCYGIKPSMNKLDEEYMKQLQNQNTYVETPKENLLDKRSEYYKNKLSEILVNPFNKNKWSRYRRI